MKTIEDRLTQATSETQSHIARMQLENRAGVERRVRAGRMLAGATAVVLVFGVFGVTALVVSSNTDRFLAPGAGGAAPPTTLGSQEDDPTIDTTTTFAPTEPFIEAFNAPHLAIGLEGWTVVESSRDRSSSWSLLYSDAEGVSPATYYQGEDGNKVAIEGNRVSIEVIVDGAGGESDEMFDQAVASLSDNEDLGIVVTGTVTGTPAEALAFGFTDPNTEESGFTFVWRPNKWSVATVTAFVDSFEEAARIVESITEPSDLEWNEIFFGYEEAPGQADVAYPTTTIAMPTNPSS